MNTLRVRSVFLVASVILGGCGSSPDVGTGPVDQWLGDTPHFVISGTFGGRDYSSHLEGDAAIAAQLRCNRAYAPLPGVQPAPDGTYDTSQVYFVMKQIGVVIDIDGQPKAITVGYWRHDAEAGTDLEVIPQVLGGSIPEGKTWVDFKVELPDPKPFNPPSSPVRLAESGTVAIKLNSGTPGPGGVYVASGGRAGELVSISWGPHESLKISATSDCQDSEVVTWARPLLAP